MKYTNLNVSGVFLGKQMGVAKISKADNYALSEAEKNSFFVPVEFSAASKVLTLGLAENQVMLVKNVGATNAVTVKNISGDTGTSLAAGKIALCVGGTTANTATVDLLN